MDMQSDFGHRDEVESWVPLDAGKTHALGIHRFALDGRNEVVGWKLSERWYLGRQRGDDSGLALVWQHDQTRFSLTPDGVRVSRSF